MGQIPTNALTASVRGRSLRYWAITMSPRSIISACNTSTRWRVRLSNGRRRCFPRAACLARPESYEIRRPEYLMVHGAPVTYFAYIDGEEAAARAFTQTDAPLIFVGHTHVAEYYALDPTEASSIGACPTAGCSDSNAASAIHQRRQRRAARDLNRDASFAFYDEEKYDRMDARSLRRQRRAGENQRGAFAVVMRRALVERTVR